MATSIEKKLAKILALAERGVKGEKKNAKRILERMLKKHGLSLSDIINKDKQVLVKKPYKYRTKAEKTLLFQVSVSIVNVRPMLYWQRKNKNIISFELTELDHVELTEMYNYYKKLLKEELSCFLSAFIQSHELYSNCTSEDSSKDVSPADRSRELRIARMMAGMKKSNYVSTRKRIGAKK